MRSQGQRTRALPVCLAVMVALFAALGCSGLTSAGLPKAKNNGANSGAGTAKVSVRSTGLNFGDVAGATSTLEVTVTNTGTSNVTVTENAASGAGFSASGIGSGLILNPAQSATLEVRFTPTSAGASSGTVPLSSDAWGSPAIIITLTARNSIYSVGGSRRQSDLDSQHVRR